MKKLQLNYSYLQILCILLFWFKPSVKRFRTYDRTCDSLKISHTLHDSLAPQKNPSLSRSVRLVPIGRICTARNSTQNFAQIWLLLVYHYFLRTQDFLLCSVTFFKRQGVDSHNVSQPNEPPCAVLVQSEEYQVIVCDRGLCWLEGWTSWLK